MPFSLPHIHQFTYILHTWQLLCQRFLSVHVSYFSRRFSQIKNLHSLKVDLQSLTRLRDCSASRKGDGRHVCTLMILRRNTLVRIHAHTRNQTVCLQTSFCEMYQERFLRRSCCRDCHAAVLKKIWTFFGGGGCVLHATVVPPTVEQYCTRFYHYFLRLSIFLSTETLSTGGTRPVVKLPTALCNRDDSVTKNMLSLRK